MESIEIILEVELSTGRAVEVEATFDYEGGLDGIGDYDYAGQKCFDKGTWHVEGVWSKSFLCAIEDLTAEEKKEIEIFCENYAESGSVEEAIYCQE